MPLAFSQTILLPQNAVQRTTVDALLLAFPWVNPDEIAARVLDSGSVSYVEIKFVKGIRGYIAVVFSYMWLQDGSPSIVIAPGWSADLPTDPAEIVFAIGEAVQIVKTRPWASETKNQFTQVAFLRTMEFRSRNGFPLMFPIGTHAVLSPSRRSVMPSSRPGREPEWIPLAAPFPTGLDGAPATRNRWSVVDALEGRIG